MSIASGLIAGFRNFGLGSKTGILSNIFNRASGFSKNLLGSGVSSAGSLSPEIPGVTRAGKFFGKVKDFAGRTFNKSDTGLVTNPMVLAKNQKDLLSKSFKYSVGTGIFDMAMTGIQLHQGLKAETPETFKMSAPRIRAPELVDMTTSAKAMQKENLAIGTNTALAYATEHGADPIKASTGIFARAGELDRKGTVAFNEMRQGIFERHAGAVADVENRNVMAEFENEYDYQTRREAAIREHNERRDFQINTAISNFGAISSRIANDYLLTNVLKSKVDESLLDRILPPSF